MRSKYRRQQTALALLCSYRYWVFSVACCRQRQRIFGIFRIFDNNPHLLHKKAPKAFYVFLLRIFNAGGRKNFKAVFADYDRQFKGIYGYSTIFHLQLRNFLCVDSFFRTPCTDILSCIQTQSGHYFSKGGVYCGCLHSVTFSLCSCLSVYKIHLFGHINST